MLFSFYKEPPQPFIQCCFFLEVFTSSLLATNLPFDDLMQLLTI